MPTSIIDLSSDDDSDTKRPLLSSKRTRAQSHLSGRYSGKKLKLATTKVKTIIKRKIASSPELEIQTKNGNLGLVVLLLEFH